MGTSPEDFLTLEQELRLVAVRQEAELMDALTLRGYVVQLSEMLLLKKNLMRSLLRGRSVSLAGTPPEQEFSLEIARRRAREASAPDLREWVVSLLKESFACDAAFRDGVLNGKGLQDD